MSVVITDCGFNPKPIKKHSPLVLDNNYKPNVITYEWNWNCQGVGDASGGTVSAIMDFSEVHLEQYHTITSVLSYNSNGDGISLATETDRWDNMFFPAHSDEPIHFFSAQATEWLGLDHRDQLVKPIYLGRINNSDGDPGSCTVWFKTNADTKLFNAVIFGFTTQFPQPFSGMLQP